MKNKEIRISKKGLKRLIARLSQAGESIDFILSVKGPTPQPSPKGEGVVTLHAERGHAG